MTAQETIQRHATRRVCTTCGTIVWSSSHRKPFVCAPCRRDHGERSANQRGEGATSLADLPKPIMTIGTCHCGCGRRNIPLVNGLCEDSRFYGIKETDPSLSAAGRVGKNRGVFDWVKRRR